MGDIRVIAVDIGASSGRLISGTYDGEKIILQEQYRFTNQPVEILDSCYWDYLKIIQEIKNGLIYSEHNLEKIDSLSVDSFGVDYGILAENGKIIQAPYSYRDNRALNYLSVFKQNVTAEELFKLTGTKLDPINTIVQLFADLQLNSSLKAQIDKIIFMPNLIKYFLSGQQSVEYTIASTSGLLDCNTRKVNEKLCAKLDFNPTWFDNVETSDLGYLKDKAKLCLKSNIKVLNGVGHDTAAALISLPVDQADWTKTAFISCGTWSIVGTQTNQPIISKEAFEAGITNEGCQGQKNRILKNITGLWIIQELQREWENQGEKISFNEMTLLAKQAKEIKSRLDLTGSDFVFAGDMEERIYKYLQKTKQVLPKNKAELLRIVYESLASSYAEIIRELERITGRKFEDVYMFGGGIQNKFLVSLTEKYTKKSIKLGAVEASVLGNIVDQLEILGAITAENKKSVLNKTYQKLRGE